LDKSESVIGDRMNPKLTDAHIYEEKIKRKKKEGFACCANIQSAGWFYYESFWLHGQVSLQLTKTKKKVKIKLFY